MNKEEAIKRVMELRHFYRHLSSYILTNIILLIINLATQPKNLWFYWVTIFWEIPIIFHAYHIFIKERFLNKEWEKRKIEELTKENEKSDERKMVSKRKTSHRGGKISFYSSPELTRSTSSVFLLRSSLKFVLVPVFVSIRYQSPTSDT